jgi:hypothetical protein
LLPFYSPSGSQHCVNLFHITDALHVSTDVAIIKCFIETSCRKQLYFSRYMQLQSTDSRVDVSVRCCTPLLLGDGFYVHVAHEQDVTTIDAQQDAPVQHCRY